jgi:hypothetical protein
MPPAGYVGVVETTLGSDCQLHVSGEKFVPANSPSLQPTSPTSRGSSAGASGGTAMQATSDTTATVHQRLWDAAGILLNEFDTVLSWQYDGNNVGGYNAYDAYAYHVENGTCWPAYSGWYVNPDNIYVSGGGVGQPTVTVAGSDSFGYQGFFSNCTNVNPWTQYWNYMTGYGSGGWSCQYYWWWASGFPGWHTQNWCGYGVN